jgi:methanogenic corrinoid protein MtbC1
MHELGGQEIRSLERSSTPRGPDPSKSTRNNSDPAVFWPLASDSWRAELSRVIEGEILPRLLLAHSRQPAPGPVEFRESPADLKIDDFVERLLADDAQSAWRSVAELQGNNRTSQEILLEYLAPAARQLGTLWETDQRDFVDVTVGLNRLHDILRRLGAEDEPARHTGELRRALLFPAPGETHVFGVAMVETFFRSAGWRVRRGGEDFLDVLGSNWFDVVGFSLSAGRHVDSLCSAVVEARAASRNPAIYVLVGGPIFSDDATLVARVGADATAIDAPSAVHLAQSLLRRRASV